MKRDTTPRGTLGIVGGGQLALMMAKEAMRMGIRTIVLDPDARCPAAQVAECIAAPLTDADAIRRLASECDVVTIDTEHVPSQVLAEVEAHSVARPSSKVMATVQDRLRQREFLAAHGFPTPSFAPVASFEELEAAVARIGAPSILKTRTGGYDGKGQARLRTTNDATEAWGSLGQRPCVLEAFVHFRIEVSALLARRPDGSKVFYEIAENDHRAGILHTTLAPARVTPAVAQRAKDLAARIADAMGHVGMMAVEMFLLPDDTLQVNEIAPRVHNSGHFTLGACATSQFEQHVRAVFDLPLGDTAQPRPAAMLNLLGDLWANGEPAWDAIESPHAHLHLYGKREARTARKMGHLTIVHASADEALRLATEADARLQKR